MFQSYRHNHLLQLTARLCDYHLRLKIPLSNVISATSSVRCTQSKP